VFQPHLEAMPVEERRALQDRRLGELVVRLKGVRSDYWREKLRGVEARGIDEITALPFTAKSELRDVYPFGSLAVGLEHTVRIHASSGTRGKPLVVAYTAADVDVFAEVNARAIASAGGRPSDVLHVAYGYGLFTGGLGFHYGGERLGATVVPASGGNPGLQLELLADFGADGLACTPSFALLLAERAAVDGLADRIHLRYGIFGAEPWSDAMRAKLEHAWGIDACDVYGLSEVIGPGVAAECREAKAGLHVFDDHFFPEIVDPASREPLPPGELGELVLTTLTKQAFPVIRYRTGDLTSIVVEACPCGRTHPRIARFTGRVDDMLVVRGINVFPSEIEAVVLSEPALGGQYAIVVDRRPALPELEVHAELADDSASTEATRARLAARLEERLRLRVGVVVYPPGSLPRQEAGKAKRVFERLDDAEPW
jgi:phenylacetate-CoA ligase